MVTQDHAYLWSDGVYRTKPEPMITEKVSREWINYMNEAREILEELYYNTCETKPGKFKMMVSCLAHTLQKRDKKMKINLEPYYKELSKFVTRLLDDNYSKNNYILNLQDVHEYIGKLSIYSSLAKKKEKIAIDELIIVFQSVSEALTKKIKGEEND